MKKRRSKNKSSFSDLCLECGLTKDSCCSLGVPLTIRDIRIIKNLGFKLEDFAYAEEWGKEDFADGEEWWKGSMIKVNNRFYRVSCKEKKNGNCFFLREGSGCILGENRPLQCRMFPFWVKKNRIIYDGSADGFCMLKNKRLPLKEKIKIIGESEKSLKKYYRMIKEDCINNREEHRKLVLRLLNQR